MGYWVLTGFHEIPPLQVLPELCVTQSHVSIPGQTAALILQLFKDKGIDFSILKYLFLFRQLVIPKTVHQ